MALCIVSLCLVCWIFRCESINQNQFSSLSDVKQALQKANIVLVNDQRDSSGVYHGEATIGDITFPLQFPWPLGTSGTIQLPSNQRLPVSDIRTFTGRLALQVGINVSLPPLQYVGLGNFGFSVRSFVISFNAGDPSSAELVFNIPGWDALNKLQFIVAQPKLNVVLGFVNHTFNVRAKGFMASSDPRSSANRLPIELAFPENLRDSLEISVADTNAVVEFSSLIFLLSSRIDTQTLQAIKAFSQNITVPKMSLRVPAGLSNISVIHVKTVSNRPFSVHGKIVMTNATFELTEDGSSFDAVIDVCGQQVSVTMLKKSGQYLILEARTNKSSTNIPISVEAFLTCVEAAKERRPDTNFIQMNVSSYKFYLRKFQINYKLRPKVSITEIGILLALPNQWNIFSQASLPTKVLNSTLSVQVILPRNSSFIEAKAEIVGQVVIGRPPLAEFPFVMKVPTRAEPLSLSLQDKTMFRMDFENVLKLGSLSRAFPSFMKPFSAGLLVTKLNLQFSPTLYGSFKIITFEMEIPSNTTWAFPYFYLGKMRIVHTSNQSHISGEIVVANFSLPCQMNWPTSKEDPVIELSESVAVKEASAFIKDVYRVFYGSEKLQNILRGLKKTKLSFMKGFWLEKALFYLSSNFSVTKVVLTGFLQNKYSWELLEDFFGVTDISVSMDIEVGQSFAVFIRGVIVLVDGSANIPFELNVPFSRNQSLAISLPVNEEPRISFQHLTGILSTAVRSKFPTALGSWLPELVLKKQKISFDEKLTEFEINELEAVRNTPWDLGGIGALNISNVTVFMDPNLFSLRGFLALGNIVLELELTKLPQGQMFRLVKPVKAHGLEPLVKDAFKKMIPGLKSTPDVSLLGLNILDASSVQLAEVKFTNNLDSLYSFAVTVSIAKTWSFFQSSFSLIDPTMNLRVQDLGDIPNFTLDVSGSLEFLANGNRLLLPLACNVPESHSSMITLKLQRAVVFNLSNIAALPVVGTLIPAGLLASISDFIGDVRLWPFEANFEPVTAHLNSSQLTVTALKKWELKGFPLALENITLKVSIKQTVEATLLGKIFLRAFPISVRIQFPLSLPDMLELKMNFQDVPDVTLKDIGKQLLSGFDLQHLFPPVFENLKISMRFLDLRLSPPLRQLQMNSFRARFVLKNTVTIIANWLSIGDIYADLTVTTTRKVSVAGSLACLVMLGNGANIMHTQGILTMPRYSSEPWELIIPEQGSQLSVSNIVALTGGGFDLKALFPDQILAKADKFVLKMFKAVFNSNAQFQIFNITCAFQANLSDVWLPLRVKIQHIDIKLVIESPFTAKQSVKVKIYVVISVGEAVVQTVLAVHKDFVLLNIESLKDQALTLSDLANLIGDVQVLKSVPVAFLNSHMTLNSLSLAFRKPQFDMFNVSVRCDLHGFDVGFSFPLPVPDPSNNFKASLAVQYLKFAFKHNREWKLTAAVKASFTGIPLEKHFKALEGLITVTPQMTILTLTKKLLDYRINLKLAGLDCSLNFAFSDPKIVFETPTKPEISISLVVTGFDILNKLFPFKVFKDKVEMYVFITEETSMAIKLKTIPIRDELLPCKEDGQEEYVCDFTWLCNKDSFVRLKLPSLAYTRDGLSAIIDVQGLEKLCVPLMLPIFRHFLKNIPFLYNLLKKNIPLWPPPDIIGSLHRIGCNTDNLPKGMERFKHPEFPNEIIVRFSVSENGPLSLALEVQNGESVDVVMPIGVTGDLAAISFRRFSIGTVFGLPFVDIDSELYLWDLKFLILLSHLPRKNSLLINAEEMETRIICKDCFVVILGFIPIPIFAAPLSVKYATIIDLQAQVTIYHRRPDLKDLGTIASLLTGLIKYYTDIEYLLSMSDMQSANNTLLVLKLSHENDVTGLQLPKYTGGKKLKLSVPPIDGKKFLIAWMNFMKTFELKWLLQMVPLRYRVLNVAFNIGPFKWSLLKFAASSPNELRQNQNIWPYPVKESGDDALIIASTDLLLLSADASFRMKNFGNFGLSLRLNAGITRLVKISFDAAAKINLEDSLNPMLISANAELKLVNVPLLTGEVNVTKDTITVLGELKLNFLGVIKLGGKVAAVYGPGLVFSLDAAVNLDFVGVRLANAHLYIKESPSKSVVRASCSFMGSDMNVEILRRGSSILVQAQVKVVALLRVDLGKISIFGRDIGRIVLDTGFSCDLTISFPGRSSLEASFNFMGINIKLPTLAFESRDTRPSRILSLLVNHVTKKAPDLIKGLFQKNLRQLLKAIMDGLVKIVGNVGEFVKDILKTGLKLGAELVKDVGVFLNNLADSTKKIAEAAAKAAKAVAEAAKAAREAAKEAMKVAGKAVKQVSKVAEQAGRQLVEAGNALLQATQKVIRVGNTVREAKRVLKNISNTLSNVVNVIGQIAHKIADEIARGIRNIAGKVVKTFKRWFGKRSIHRRDILMDQKHEKERQKQALQRKQSNQQTRVRQKERELNDAKREEELKRTKRNDARNEALRSSDNLKKALKEKTDKVAVYDDIIKTGKCASGEHNCHSKATCLRSGPDGLSYKCICKRGWVGNGVVCQRPIKGVVIMSDSPKAVGKVVSFSSFALSGTDVQYKYSFNSKFSEYGFASRAFNSPGVYVVNVLAKNSFSSDLASEIVVVQAPVSNVKLDIDGDRRACRAVHLTPSASGTNVSFTIDFGDNTSLENVTESVTHYFPHSGEFTINITAWNFVSSSNKTFVLRISSTPCDKLYCDIWAIETMFPDKTITKVASLAWSLQQASKAGTKEIRFNKLWKYLSLFNPVSQSVLQKLSTENIFRNRTSQYSFSGSTIEIDFILAGILSSRMGYAGVIDGHDSSPFLPYIQRPLDTFTWITAALLPTSDFLNHWNTSTETTLLCQELLPTCIINSAIDGYILGALATNFTENTKLSNIVFEYYCPSNQSTQYNWKNRYLTLNNLSKILNNGKHLESVVTTSTFSNLAPNLEGFVSPIKGFCVRYLFESLWSEINTTNSRKISTQEKFCKLHTTCRECVSFGAKGKCFWCESYHACLPNNTWINCSHDQTFFKPPCPQTCHLNRQCRQCVSKPSCGWCESRGSGFCTEGKPRGPNSIAACSRADWYYETCALLCPMGQGRLCSGKGMCKAGRCYCLPGVYGKDCSKEGCVYKTKPNDTLNSMSSWSHVREIDIKMENIGRITVPTVVVNSIVTIPILEKKPKCVNATVDARFHRLFPRILRTTTNMVGLDSFCGLFGSIAAEKKSQSSCKGITSKEQCLKKSKCTWNIKEPCTGIIFNGCFKLSHWVDLVVKESEIIHSPISGNVKIKGDSVQITGWPNSEWESYIVDVSGLKPNHVTSIQSGEVIGTTLPKINPLLSTYIRIVVSRNNVFEDPKAYLLPCSSGCSQMVHFYNGICDQACNSKECNHDNGDCIPVYSNQTDFVLKPRSIHDLYSSRSLSVLYQLQKITGEKNVVITRGPISVFSLAKLVVLEVLNSSAIHSTLVYKNYRHPIIKYVSSLRAQNMTVEKITLLTAERLIELGVYNVSVHGRSGSDYDIAEIETSSLENENNFQVGLNMLVDAQLLRFTLVRNDSQAGTPYFQLVIPRDIIDVNWFHHFDASLIHNSPCDSLTSCSGHGVCFNNGSCKCDAFYMGRKCQFNNCPGRCSGHGTCLEGVCVCSFGWEGEDCSEVKLCTPLCPEAWIGDGVCDPDCDTPKCLKDKGDCRDVCICPEAWLSDGSCDQMCNTSVCKLDGGDCVEEECSPGCRLQMLGDSICDHQCNTEMCQLDKGDCGVISTCTCSLSLQGNGLCDEECNNVGCMYDYGDCAVRVTGENCPHACSPPMIANGFCDLSCNVPACNFDGGDCNPDSDTKVDFCSEGCIASFRGDGVCDSVCNVEACGFDNGDCPKSIVQECSPECRLDMVGDGTCQSQCLVEECSFDANDCQCASGCLNSSLGNGVCNVECFVGPCDYDNLDCMCPPKKCPKHFVGNGNCDVECNNRICDFDGGDCECAPGCSLTSIADGSCDPACDTKLCHFDGLDCGGCEADTHSHICDENAYCVVTNKSLPFVQCQCKSGFYGDGFSCLKRGNCFNGSDICSRNGRCVASNGTFECYCNPGWKGNGIFCENVDECKDQSHSCSINARCVDLPGGYKCVCETGWTGDGFNCTDINECKIDRHSCCENERCVNKEGNYSCECKDGWQENSSSPTTSERCTTGINPTCVDVDECAEEIHNCSTFNGQANAVCTNTIGGFLCTCEHGWQGDGFYCSDINECVNSSVCGINQLCRNLAGNYSCSCKDGWTFSDSSNNECQDVDECLLGLDDCDVFASCVNTDGSFTCECMKGFEDKGRICTRYHCINQTNNGTHLNDGNITATNNELCTCSGEYLSTGRTCADIDECMLDNFNCPSSAPICQNLMGGYECTCNAVDNSSCDAVSPCDSSNNTCNENMTCIEVGIEHYCVCPEGYTEDQNGTACIDINECINLKFYGSCDVNAECINVEGSFECKCRPGFFQSGDTCFEIDECEGTISNTVEGRLQECHAGACASTQTCAVYNVSNDDSKASNTSLICACEEDDNRKLDCVEAKLTIVQSGVNVSTLISIPWNLTLNTTSSATVTNNYTLLAHNCSTRAVCSNTAGSYKCVCLEGFQSNDGGWTCFDTDECLANDTCHPNATCSNTEGSFNCTCKSGFIGNGINNCSDIDECSFVNCSQNSVCVNTVGDYFCSCQDGFRKNTNLLCEDIDECFNSSLNRCHPRASCHNYIGGYNCSCKIGYSGDGLSCSDINECMDSSILCGEHASCYNTLGSYKCTCNPGWTGDGQNCSNIDECALGLHTCVENSYCSDNQGSYTCSCHRGWMRQWFEPYGRCSRCDSTTFCSGHGQCLRNGTCDCLSYYSGANCSVCIPDVRCSGHGVCDFNGTCYCDHGWTRQPLDCGVCFPEELCSGHGICNYDLMTYKNKSCFCNDNYYSHNCSKACPIIKGEICGPHGSCTQDHGGLRPCICHLGYQWNDNSSSCEDTDECVAGSHDCLSPARCINTPGSYRCECPSLVGWSFDGKSCSDTDECQFPDVCHPHASCTNYPGGFKCSCNTGWRGQGEHPVCSDIDECGEGIDRCPNPSRCINTVGSYYCECNSGWQKVSQFQCVDIDECSRGIHGCDRNSYCVNTAGSWKCVCNNGWYPDPSNARLPTCRDVNECVNKPNACPQQSTCTNSPGSYQCNCLSGWRNQGPHSCSDVNECSEGSHRCPYNSQCINTAGSYVCNCLSGWRNRDHYSCVDVNECSEGRFSCPANSHCVNTQGSYRCDCNRCFYKSGSTCNNDCRLQTQYYYTTTYTTYTTYYSTSCGWHGLSRCRESRRKRKTKSRRTSRQVWVGNRPGARCPCT